MLRCFLYYHCRQTQPSEDNLAVNCLAEDVQVRNIRKLEVNARVAAFLWMLEYLAVFCVGSVWVLVYRSSSALGHTQSIMWFYVIIPYSNLMNTSYNKERIVDDGWKSVFVNSVSSILPSIFKRNNSIQPIRNENEGQDGKVTSAIESN